jgi:uncharacterized protein
MGQLIRILIILAAIGMAVYLLRRALGRGKKPGAPSGSGTARMVACAHCGTHVPESEAVRADGRTYCCEEHRRQGDSG